jgi:hypothetical protein
VPLSAEAIRRRFIKLHGQIAFEVVASAFAEVGGDSSKVSLTSIPAWRQFATSLQVVPRSEMISQAFLWCARHHQPLLEISRPTVPAALRLIHDTAFTEELFNRSPFFLSSSPGGHRCEKCFDEATRFSQRFLDNSRSEKRPVPHTHLNRRASQPGEEVA